MTIDQPVSEFFTAGGTLPPDAPSYVKRPTDDELFRHIMAGEFCYVLTLQRRFALLRRFKALETCKNALICPFFGVSKRRSNIQHVVVI